MISTGLSVWNKTRGLPLSRFSLCGRHTTCIKLKSISHSRFSERRNQCVQPPLMDKKTLAFSMCNADAKRGIYTAQVLLSQCYRFGYGCEKDEKKPKS